jgi:ABC-type dipeptide/oligopeptide/nickel transport system permease component
VIFFTVWAIGSVLLGMLAAYRLGQVDPEIQDKIFATSVIIVFGWPAFLVVILILLPFYGMYKLGDRNRKKKEVK